VRHAIALVGLALLAACVPSVASAASAATHAPARAPKPLLTLDTTASTRGAIELRWHVRVALRSASVRVNGHVVRTDGLALRRGQAVRFALGSADRVRFGRNHVVVVARGRDGRRQTLRRTVVLRHDAPLVGVRKPGAAVAGRAIRLDGRGSRAARGGRLHYRWRIVDAPHGAHATVRGATSARPRLVASTPGRYHVALTVTEDRRGRSARAAVATDCAIAPTADVGAAPAATASAAASTSTPALSLTPGALTVVAPQAARPALPLLPAATKAAPGCATADTAVDVMPNDGALGVAFDSRATQGGTTGVRIGTSLYALPQTGALLLLFDAETLQPLYQWTDTTPTPLVNAQVFAANYAAQGHDVLIVSAGLYNCCGSHLQGVSSLGWTVVEPYLAAGDAIASENLGVPLTTGGPDGQMTGWLQQGVPLDGAPPVYTFVSPDRATFTTRVGAASATSNTMQIASNSYTSTLPSGATAGYQVLLTDATLTPIAGTPAVFGTNGPDAAAQEQAMADLLTRAQNQPGGTVMVQSINRPRPASEAAATIGVMLQELGGSQWMSLSQDGSGDYALVGNPDHDVPALSGTAAETSQQWNAGSGGSLQGVLRRRDDSAWAPMLADAIGTPNYGLAQVVYQAPTAWPQTDTPGKIAATTWMAEQLGLVPGPGSCWQPSLPDFRSSYCDDALDTDAVQDELQRLDWPGASAGFSQAEFTAVQGQLETELDDLGTVRTLFTALNAPFGSPGADPEVDAQEIAGKILAAIPPPTQSATSAGLSLAASIISKSSSLPEVGAVLGPIASILDLAGALTQTAGQPSPDWDIQTQADLIGGTVRDRLQAMSGSLGRFEAIFVSDWGKMSTAARDAVGPWGVSATGITDEESTLELGIDQWMWTAIAPSAFHLVAISGATQQDTGDNVFCFTNHEAALWFPWRHADQRSLFFPLGGFSGGAATSGALYGMLSGTYHNSGSTPVSSALAHEMFDSPAQGGAGLVAPWLFNQGAWTIDHPTLAGPNTPEEPGVCQLGQPG
jgi:hypothetical protein